MSFDSIESSRHSATPTNLYYIRGSDTDAEVQLGPFTYCDGETAIVRDGVTYQPWPIKHSGLSHDGTLDKSDVTVSMARGTPIDDLFLAYPPSQVVNLTIFQGHVGTTGTEANFPAIWLGRITGAEYRDNELDLSCSPVSTSIRRPGLRRNYQIGCPHVLYGPQCKASKIAATVTNTVGSITRNNITLEFTLEDAGLYAGGLLEWTNSETGRLEIRTIAKVFIGNILTIRGLLRGLAPGDEVSLARGCDRQMTGCNLHDNILNYGGQPFIPLENPLSSKNQFY